MPPHTRNEGRAQEESEVLTQGQGGVGAGLCLGHNQHMGKRCAHQEAEQRSVLCRICGTEPRSDASPRGLWDKRGRQAGTRQLLGWVPSSPCGCLLAPTKELYALSQGLELSESSQK